jgi:hypothetical protein
MSNKYKLIKCYPNSPELGIVVTLKEKDMCESESWLFALKISEIENYPEFWEKVVEDYEVLLTVENKIHAVKRLSDNEVFKIGDLCYPKNTINNVHPIEDIDVLGSGQLRIGSINWYVNLESVVKLAKIEIKTQDGDILTSGDGGFVVLQTVLNTYKVKPTFIDKNFKLSNNEVIFSDMQKAKDYVNMKDHCLSIEEINDALFERFNLDDLNFICNRLLELVENKKFKEN